MIFPARCIRLERWWGGFEPHNVETRVLWPLERIIDWLVFDWGWSLLLSSIGATWYFGVQRTDLVLIILQVLE